LKCLTKRGDPRTSRILTVEIVEGTANLFIGSEYRRAVKVEQVFSVILAGKPNRYRILKTAGRIYAILTLP
jgi:hypothetical protein